MPRRSRPHPRPGSRRVAALATALVALVLAGTMLAGPLAAQGSGRAEPTRDELGETTPTNAPGQSLYLQRVVIPSGATLPEHFHEGTQVARVEKGVLTYDVLSGTVDVTRRTGDTERITGPATTKIRAGESLVEVESLAHRGSNDGSRKVVIVLAALLTTGAPLATPVGDDAPGTPLTVTVDLTSQSTRLTTVGPGDSVTYGWNQLTGTASDASGPVEVELLGAVAYDGGVGPFSGFVTFRFADGSVLGTQIQGAATKDASGATQFASTMGVLDGTGRYLGASGSGTFLGSRDAALGQPVKATFTLRVQTTR